MRLAIISDIHSNLEAYCEVLRSIRFVDNIEKIVILGDIVGYASNPNECVELTRVLTGLGGKLSFEIEGDDEFLTLSEASVEVVAGNHDWGVIGQLNGSYFNRDTRKVLSWTAKRLTGINRAFLESLPLTIKDEDRLYIHSSPKNPPKFEYVLNDNDAAQAIDSTPARVVFIGHTHVPQIFMFDEGNRKRDERLFSTVIEDGTQAVINVGSVGQSRDGDPRASYSIFDTVSGEVRIERVDYDFHQTQIKILKTRLPRRFADRLQWGM